MYKQSRKRQVLLLFLSASRFTGQVLATTNSSKQDDVSKLLESIPRLAEMFHIRSRVGEGTFSTVYVGTLKQGSRCKTEYAIKHIVPTSHPNRILFELKCLKLLG